MKLETRQRVVPLRYEKLLILMLDIFYNTETKILCLFCNLQGDDKAFFRFRLGSQEVRNYFPFERSKNPNPNPYRSDWMAGKCSELSLLFYF